MADHSVVALGENLSTMTLEIHQEAELIEIIGSCLGDGLKKAGLLVVTLEERLHTVSVEVS